MIAPDLILTCGHVVDYPTYATRTRVDWKVCLLRERTQAGSWDAASVHDAEVVWRGPSDLDLALLKLSGNNHLTPTYPPVFASYDLAGPIADVDAAGFPQAWSETGTARDYSVRGILRVASLLGPFAWSVLPSDKPDDPQGWKGMSGAAACRIGVDDKIYLLGTVQQVPANFSHGQLEITRISSGFDNPEFLNHLQKALGTVPRIVPFQLEKRLPDFGIAQIFRARTIAFADEYLKSETNPVPFGGRDVELRCLNDWLLDPNAPARMLITSPAGRGKSALLVQWINTLQEGGVTGPNGWQLAFMPISIRVGTM